MVPEEALNFLRFSTALKIIVGRSVRLDQLDCVKTLLRDYLLTYLDIYGESEVMPNHHWAVHVPDQLPDYGPVYNFWAFLTERLNKLLKNLNSNNWTGGELEVLMMREFHRNGVLDSTLHRFLSNSATDSSPSLVLESKFIRALVTRDTKMEALGTLQDAARTELHPQLALAETKPDPLLSKPDSRARRIPSAEETVLITVNWMNESKFSTLDGGDRGFVWYQFPELGVNTLEYEEYKDPRAEGSKPFIMPLSKVECQISRGTLKHTEPPMWISTTMD
ncbi:hypothetical protein C8J57DRAFT_1245473 [Mycena rebaudengoi]|nr:hypothetical protein C8J57DRAFT_1245473 [Mycena rebaudengoi]